MSDDTPETRLRLLERELEQISSKLSKLYDVIHGTDHKDDKGILKRLGAAEEITSDVQSLKTWAQGAGLVGITGAVASYWEQFKAAFTKLGGP